MSDKIRILFLSANPLNTARIRVDEEAREIFLKLEATPDRDAFELFKYPAIRNSDLQSLLMKHEPHIVHYSGHGAPRTQGIILETASGRGKKVEPRPFANLFKLFNDQVRLVFLNACRSRDHAMALAEVVDYSIGVSSLIRDRAAVAFAAAFYMALAYRRSVQQAFESAAAELKLRNLARSQGYELFVRARSGVTASIRPHTLGGNTQPVNVIFGYEGDHNSDRDKTSPISRATIKESLIQNETSRGVQSTPDLDATFLTQGDSLIGAGSEEQLLPPLYFGIQPPPLMFIGREDAVVEVRGLLRSAATIDHESKVIVVRGWPGVGKTAFAGVLARDPEILREFPDGVLWAVLGQKPDLMTKLAEWTRALRTDELRVAQTLNEAVAKFAALIRRRRTLLILDDVWNPADAVPFVTAVMGSSCAVLATTRLPKVAATLTRQEQGIYHLPVLSESSSLALLRSLEPDAVDKHPDQCAAVIRECGCLPLALHAAGRLLRAETKMGLSLGDLLARISGTPILLKEPAPIDRAEECTLPTIERLLQRSGDALDESTRNYFSYLASFGRRPAIYEPASMQAIWQTDDPLPIIRKLVGNGLLEPVPGGRFQIHELLVTYARSLIAVKPS